MVDNVDIALCICKLLLYNNFKRGVMSQVNFCVTFPNFGRIFVASCYGAIIGILWIIGCSFQGTVLNMISSVFICS